MTHIWLPPPSQSVAIQGYLPSQLYNLDSKYGNKQELKELCTALKAAGIAPLADIVINHRCADEKGEDGVYNRFRLASFTTAADMQTDLRRTGWYSGLLHAAASAARPDSNHVSASRLVDPTMYALS